MSVEMKSLTDLLAWQLLELDEQWAGQIMRMPSADAGRAIETTIVCESVILNRQFELQVKKSVVRKRFYVPVAMGT